MFSVTELFELNFGILSFFTILEKKLFKVSAVLDSDVSIFLFSFRFTFSLDTDLQASDLFKIVHWIEKLPPLQTITCDSKSYHEPPEKRALIRIDS